MARFVTDVPTGYTPQEVNTILSQFAQAEKFEYVNFRGENVFKKGSGWFTVPQCMKVDIYDGVVHIEAWIQNLLIPGVYLNEMDFDGYYGWIIKEAFKNLLNRLIQTIAAKPPFVPMQPQQQMPMQG